MSKTSLNLRQKQRQRMDEISFLRQNAAQTQQPVYTQVIRTLANKNVPGVVIGHNCKVFLKHMTIRQQSIDYSRHKHMVTRPCVANHAALGLRNHELQILPRRDRFRMSLLLQ